MSVFICDKIIYVMYKIITKKKLNNTVTQFEIEAPLVANKAKPGQFIILRVDADGERIPLTIAGINKEKGLVKIIAQIVGATTEKLNNKNEGEFIQDFVGPLGKATELEGLNNVCIIGGGVGCAIALPICEALHDVGANVTSIIGFRNKDLLILEDEFKKASNQLIITSDDGSVGIMGNVTMPLDKLLSEGKTFDKVITIGPLIMMKFVVETCKKYNVPCLVSMNSIMVDGTGMCGGCRLSLNIDGKKITKFACVDGPDFNGYEIDFDEAMMRSRIYSSFERKKHEETCNLFKKSK